MSLSARPSVSAEEEVLQLRARVEELERQLQQRAHDEKLAVSERDSLARQLAKKTAPAAAPVSARDAKLAASEQSFNARKEADRNQWFWQRMSRWATVDATPAPVVDAKAAPTAPKPGRSA
jgi:hypothetical protein